MKIISRSALLLAAFLSLAACGNDSTGSNRLTGSTEFRYSGAFSGEFRAQGSPLANFETGSYAFGQQATTDDGEFFVLFAQQDLQGDRVNDLLLTVERPAVGSVTCAEDDLDDCPFGAFLALGANGKDPEAEPDAFLFSTGGTVTITSLTEKRARGTFRLSFGDLFGGDQVQVSSGTFDVPLINDRASFSRGTLSRARLARSR